MEDFCRTLSLVCRLLQRDVRLLIIGAAVEALLSALFLPFYVQRAHRLDVQAVDFLQ